MVFIHVVSVFFFQRQTDALAGPALPRHAATSKPLITSKREMQYVQQFIPFLQTQELRDKNTTVTNYVSFMRTSKFLVFSDSAENIFL